MPSVTTFKTSLAGLSPSVATSNAVTLSGIIGLSSGGTGATNQTSAANAVLPNQATNAGKFLTTNGATVAWASFPTGGGTGTVTSVAGSGGTTGLTLGGTITTSGVLTLGGTLNIANGGTGANTANGALNNLLPSQPGFGGRYLITDGTNVSWAPVSSAGTVTSVGMDGGTTGLDFYGGPITNSGTMTMAGILTITSGGTGANTKEGALSALLPVQGPGTIGRVLMSNGTYATWASTGGGGGGGSGTVQSVDVSGGLTGLTTIGGPIDINNPSGTIVFGGVLNAASGGLGFDASAATQGQVLMADGSGGLVAGDINNTDSYVSVDTTVPGTITLGLPKNSITLGTTVAYLGDTETFIDGLDYARVNATDSSNSLNLATIAYVDSKVSNISIKAPVIAASTADIASLSGLLTIDSVLLAPGNRVLVKNQNTSTQDGIYVAAAGPWTRATDADTDAELIGASVFVTSGGQASSTWVQTDPAPGTAQSWVQSAGAGTYTAGTGLTLAGQQFSISDTAVTPGSYGTGLLIPQIQVNQQGQITSAANVAVATVLTFDAGLTGFTPSTPVAGAVTLGGILNPLSGGTGLDNSNVANNSILVANGPTVPGAGDASFSAEVLTGGTGITIVRGPGTITINSTGGGGGGGVPSFSGGTTGLTPAVATSTAITLGGTLNIANGGTQATTAAQAFKNLAPGISGNSGKYLTTDGVSTISWAALPAGLVSAYAITVTLNGSLASKLATAGITDAVGNIYEFFNSTGSIVTLTTTTVTNTVAFSDVSTANSIKVPASGSVTIVTTTAGSVYSVIASNVGAGAVSPATAGDIPILTASGGLVDSGKYFDDTDTSNNNYWSSAQTASYVVNQLLNVPSLPQVQVATTANIGLSGLAAIDGYTPLAGDFVLVKNQTTQGQNGIYKAAAGAWTRQVYNTTTKLYQNISTETLYSELNINGGVTNVQNGTVGKNLQYQFYIPDPTATIATNGSAVLVTSVTKLPVASPNNRFVDVNIGNDTNNNGSSAFPFATITRAQTGMSYPGTITLSSSGGSYTGNVSFTNSQSNCTVQGQNFANDGGQTQITGQVTFGNNNTRVDFVNTVHNTGALPPFVFSTNALCRSYFQSLVITTSAPDWLGLLATTPNWITLDNLDFGNPLATAVNLPVFSAAFQLNLTNQSRQVLRVTGTGAANTIINVTNCNDGMVWIEPSFVGTIIWQGLGFYGNLGSAAVPTGVLSTQGAMDTVTGWTTDSTYDGWYAIDNFAPTSFQQGAIFGKYTVGGTTFLYWGRDQNQAPATISTTTDTTYQKTATGWSLIGGTSALAQDLSGGAAGQVVWQQGVDDTAFTAVGTVGQYLKSNATAAPTWATVPQSNYISTSTGGTVASKIIAPVVDVKGASYVIYNSGGSAIILTATGFDNYQSFPDSSTSTTLTINPFQSAVLTTTTATTNYAIEAVTGLSGGSTVYAVSANSDTTMAAVLSTASIVDAAEAVYVITNIDTAAHTVALGTTVMNPGAFPGYIANPNITIPAGGTATVTTASPDTSYYVMNISNSVAADLSGGLINEIPYQVSPDNTGFIANAAGDANKYLMSNGVASAPSWQVAPGTRYLAAGADSTVAALISGNSLTDVISASYVIVNTSGANINITATNFVNSVSFSTVATATQVTLKPNQTLLISTRTVNTNYVIDAVSGLGGGGTTALTISTGGTLTALLAAASVTDQVGNTYVVTNTATASTPLTVGTVIDNATSFPNSIVGNIITLLPKQVVTLTTTVFGANYTVENLSDVQNTFSLSISANDTMTNILSTASVIDYVGNTYTINNTAVTASTVTFGAVVGYTAFPDQGTNTTVIIPAGGSATVFTTALGTNYQLVTIANPAVKTYYIAYSTAGATKTMAALLTGAGITDVVGNNYVIYNTLTASFALTATSFPNLGSYPRLGSTATSIPFPAGYSIEFTTTVVGSTYAITAASQTLPIASVDFAANKLVTDLPATGKTDIIGQVYSVYNSHTAAITLTTTGAYSNYLSYPNSATATVITIQPKQTIELATESVGLNYRIVSASNASGVYKMNASADGTIPALLTTNNITDVAQNIYTINNTGTVTISLTATAFTGYAAYSNQATSTAIGLLPGGSAVLSVNSAGNYQILNVSATGSASTNTFKVSATNAVTIPGVLGPIAFNTVDFDPMSCWNAAQSRWYPKVAGYYQVNVATGVTGSADILAAVYKNGIVVVVGNVGNRSGYSCKSVSTVVYLNGTTDYLQGGGRCGQASAGVDWTSLSASLQTAQPAVAASNALARATVSATQSITNNANTKVTLGQATYNPRGWFDSINNSRFQPNIAGYYQVTGSVAYSNAWTAGISQLAIYKNGGFWAYNQTGSNSQGNMFCEVSDLVYLNGSSDYLELYVYQNSGSAQTLVFNTATNYLDAALVGGIQVPTGTITQGTSNTFKIQSVGGGTGQAITSSPTLMTLSNTIFDPNGAYTTGTGQFKPTTPGYYRLTGRAGLVSSTEMYILVYVNGASVASNSAKNTAGLGYLDVEINTVAYFNGTTDYAQIYVSSPSGATTLRTDNQGQFNEFSADLVGGVTSTPLATGPQLFKSFYGVSSGTYVGLPGDGIQVAWVLYGIGWNIFIKNTTGTITPKGWVSYFRGPGAGGGLSETLVFGSGTSSIISTITATATPISSWQFNATGDNVFFEFVDPATGYNYQIRGMLNAGGNNNVFTITRNVNNA